MNHIYRVIRMPVVPHKVMIPASELLLSSIRDEVPVDDHDTKLRTVIRIFQNSHQPIRSTKSTSVDEVCQSITGQNLRWETIGNILAMAGLCVIHMPARDFLHLDAERRSKHDLVRPFHEITDTLAALTNASPVVNELGVCLKYNQLLLALYRFGDSSMFPFLVPTYPPALSHVVTLQFTVNMFYGQANTSIRYLWTLHHRFTRRACIKTTLRAARIRPSTLASCTSGAVGASPRFTQWTRTLPLSLAVRP